MFESSKSLRDFNDKILFESLLEGINDPELKKHLLELYQDACNIHYVLFEDDFFKQRFFANINRVYGDLEGDNILTYILPAIRRVFATFFINIPPIFTGDEKRKELFQLHFNLEEFLTELSNKLKKNINILDDFDNLDRGSEILQLIVNDYVSSTIKKTRINNTTQAIRELKLERHLKI